MTGIPIALSSGMVGTRFDDEISYADAPSMPSVPSTRANVRVLGFGPESAIGVSIRHPESAIEIFRTMMLSDRETLAVMCLDENRKVITTYIASVGTATEVAFSARTVFQPAMLVGASYLLIAHNHPSGNPTPSDADVETTKLMEVGSKILGIELVDHLVLTTGRAYRSVFEYMETGC